MEKNELSIRPVARLRCDLPAKFGLPRQSGLVAELRGAVVFEPEYRNPDALRGLEEFSHVWLIWGFSENAREGWSPTVRPPRLGGNRRLGVFATRSPFRPNPLGLSCVKLEAVEPASPDGPRLLVSGADLMDGTPIYDVKPYLPYADCLPDACGGFADAAPRRLTEVDFPAELLRRVPEDKRAALTGILAQDPRPAYHDDPERVYGFTFAGLELRFSVAGGALTVLEVENKQADSGG